jgi:Uncharacterised nucleotidyltransferase
VSEILLSEAVPLAHALLERVAEQEGVRVLFVKGPAAAEQGLRAARTSVDVDAMVDPAQHHRLAERLGRLGWVDDHPYTSPTVLPMHSTTHRHAAWPCELDIHDRFPGFFADRQDVFERLWARRQHVVVAARRLPCPDDAGHALVLALHALRDPHAPGKAAELEDLAERVGATSDAASLRDLADLAHALGAADTAAPFLERVGAPAVGRGSTPPEDLQAWRLRTQPEASVAGWLDELRRLPKRQWPRFLWYAAVLTETELRLDDPSLPPGRGALARARLRRLRRGLRAVPVAARNLRRHDRSRSADG